MPAQALAASLLDELFEIERWGRDDETERRHAALRRDVEAGALYLAALDPARGRRRALGEPARAGGAGRLRQRQRHRARRPRGRDAAAPAAGERGR